MAAIAVAALAMTVGCGSGDVATVSGKVTADGAPVTEGELLFSRTGGGVKPVNVGVESDGSYKVEGVGIGKANVSYTAPAGEYPEGSTPTPGEAPPNQSKWTGYRPVTSEFDVKAGEQTIDIELTK